MSGSDRKRGGRGASSLTVRTLGVVSLVTVLTWLLAESQTVQRRTLTVDVRLDAGGDSRALRVVPGSAWDGLVEVTLEGAAANVEAVRREARNGFVLTLGEEIGAEPGERVVDLRDALRLDAALVDSGVSVVDVSVPEVAIEVRTVGEVLLPVAVGLAEGSEGEVTVVDPAAVLARGPTSVLELLGDTGRVTVPESILEGLLPGQSAERVSLAVSVEGRSGERMGSGLWGLRVSPERVAVSVTVRSRVTTAELGSVPVQVLLAPSELDRWEIELAPEDRDIRGVRVTGPAAAVQRVVGGELPLVAVVRLSFEELERGVTVKEAELPVLPGGLRVEADDLTVGVTVRRRGGDGLEGLEGGVGGGVGGG